MPIVPDDNSTGSVFADVAAVYAWDSAARGYFVPATIEPEEGYWVAVTEATTVTVTGAPVESWTTGIGAGWNMIGSITDSTNISEPNDNPDGSIQPFAYWWDPVARAYDMTTDIEPGKGYWVASVQDCDLTLP